MLVSFPGGLQKVLATAITPDGFGVIQAGIKHIKFHTLYGKNVVSKNGLLGRLIILDASCRATGSGAHGPAAKCGIVGIRFQQGLVP